MRILLFSIMMLSLVNILPVLLLGKRNGFSDFWYLNAFLFSILPILDIEFYSSKIPSSSSDTPRSEFRATIASSSMEKTLSMSRIIMN